MHPDDLPASRPTGLRLVTRRGRWFRFDTTHPDVWGWTPFADPRHRFDSLSGAQRLRYAGRTLRGAARERWDATGRVVSERDGDGWLVELTGEVSVLDLRREATLDVLGVDDRVNTGRLALDRRDDMLLDVCGRLTDLVADWWGPRLHGIQYRSRTTPETSSNLAFFAGAPLRVADACRVAELGDRWVELILRDGFLVDASWAPA